MKCDNCYGFGFYVKWIPINNGAKATIEKCIKCLGKGKINKQKMELNEK